MKVLSVFCFALIALVFVSLDAVDASQKHKGLAAVERTTTTTEKPDESDDSKESENDIEEPVNPNKEGKIRQCNCTEMETCFKQQQEKVQPCTEKCLDELKFGEGDATVAKKCFAKNHEDIHACRKNVATNFCAADSKTFILESEAFNGSRQHSNQKSNNATSVLDKTSENDINPHNYRKHRGGFGFHAFLKANFGEAGKNYVKCQRKCFQRRRKNNCLKKIGCGLKRLDKKDFEKAHSTCKSQEDTKKKELCDCLTAAGVKNVVCSFESNKKKN